MGSKRKSITKDEAKEIVKKCTSIADFCRSVGWVPRGDNYKTFHRYVKKYELDISHFTGQRTNLENRNNRHLEKTAEEYSKSEYVRSTTFLQKLIKEGYKEKRCEYCGNTTWLGGDIPLELHHKDGNHFNNDISNVEVLCPNCHAKTDFYRGAKNKKEPAKKHCKYCGKEVSRWSKSLVCQDCSHRLQRKVERPEKEELKKLLETYTISEIGRKYGVSFQTVKKWAKRYNII